MFYADDAVLDPLESQLITYTAIVCLGLAPNVRNHLGGLLRMGLEVEVVEQVTECAGVVARWAGCEMKEWVDVRAVADGLE